MTQDEAVNYINTHYSVFKEPYPLMDFEEARTQLMDILKMMAALFFPTYVAWETYRARSGKNAGGE